MPKYRITAPDGKTFDVEGDGTAEEALAHVQSMYQAKAAQPEAPVDPSAGGGTLSIGPFDTGIKTSQGVDRFLAGAGRAIVNVGRGAEQVGAKVMDRWFPQETSRSSQLQAEEAQRRQQDAPLTATTAGKIGGVVGGIATAVPSMAIPGANTVAGAGLIGATYGMLQPTVSDKERAINTAVGGATGAVTQYAGQKLGQWATNKLGQRAAKAAEDQALNAERDAVLAEARKAGYVVPPTAAKDSALNTALESVSGKAATRQAMSAANAKVTNAGVADDLGLDPAKPLTRSALQGVRAKAGKVYQAVKSLGKIDSDQQYLGELTRIAQSGDALEQAYPGIGAQANQEVQALIKAARVDTHDAGAMVGLSKMLRNRATSNFKAAFGSGGNPEKLELARAQSEVANAVEDLIQRHLDASGNGALGQAWGNARTTIAKSYQAEAALKGSNVSAVKLAQQLQKGRPVTGKMGLAARFAEHFDEVAKVPKSGAGVSKLAATLNTAGIGTALMTGNVPVAAGLVAAGTAPYAVRNGLMTGIGQSLLATPSYAPGLTGNALLRLTQQAPNAAIPLAAYTTQK